jgi:hypothetical protein
VSSFIFTTNGSSWSSSGTVPHDADANGVSCTASACVAAGLGVYVSTDGGNTWASKTVGGGIQGLFKVSCIPGTVTCLAVGTNPEGAFDPIAQGQLVITTDDGDTWNDSSSFPASTAGSEQISCTTGDACGVAGFASPTPGHALFVGTTDAGASWSSPSGPTGFSNPGGPNAGNEGMGIACPSSTTCVLVGYGGSGAAAAVTTNGGVTWTASSVQ